MLQLTERAEVWRFMHINDIQQETALLRGNVPCLVIPISDFDTDSPYARESTHVIFLPRWWASRSRKEDEIRTGRRVDSNGNAAPFLYVVNGIRRYATFGLRHVELFCRERD